MSEPTDDELLRFVAEFCGWTRVVLNFQLEGLPPGYVSESLLPVTDYLNSLDSWHRDIWPKIEEVGGYDLESAWDDQLELGSPGKWKANASAKTRCLALYRALNCILPNPGTNENGVTR